MESAFLNSANIENDDTSSILRYRRECEAIEDAGEAHQNQTMEENSNAAIACTEGKDANFMTNDCPAYHT